MASRIVTHMPWWLAALVGLLTLALGLLLIVRPFESLSALVVLLAVGLIVMGISNLVAVVTERGPKHAPRIHEAEGGPTAPPATGTGTRDITHDPATGAAANGTATGRRRTRDRLLAVASTVLGATTIVVGVLVLVLPALTMFALSLIVGILLIVQGVVRLATAAAGTWDDRLAKVLLGVSGVILGIVALVWPDVTVLVIAAIFGVQVVLFGVDLLIGAFRRMRAARHTRRSRSSVVAAGADRAARAAAAPAAPAAENTGNEHDRAATPTDLAWRIARTSGAIAAIIATVALLIISVNFTTNSQPDDFYTAPADVPDEPGQLLRVAPFTNGVPDNATGWRILYTTTRDDGVPGVASALVITPNDGAAAHPVVAWAHGTTGYARNCAPSVLPHPFVASVIPDFAGVLAQGWSVVETDYIGLGTAGPHPYLIGQGEGRSVLDSVRAARQLDEAALGTETAVWGHSQGGHAALWAGGLAATYAPELDIIGVAAMSAAANLPALLNDIADTTIGGVFGSYMATAYAAAYSDVKLGDYVRPGARISVDEMARRCVSDSSTLVSVATTVLGSQPVWSGNPARGALLNHATANVPTMPINSPLFMGQGGSDQLVIPSAQDQYVSDRCTAGQQVDYRTYAGYGHMSVVEGDSPLLPDLMTWTQARLAGDAPNNTCGS